MTTAHLSKDYLHPDDHAKQRTDTPGFKPFIKMNNVRKRVYFLIRLEQNLLLRS